MNRMLCLFVAAVSFGASVPVQAARAKLIAVSANAAPAYVRPTDKNGDPVPEAYVLAEGHFMEGIVKDPVLESHRFSDLLQPLGRNLAKQKYFPASDPNDADLVIVVHWGVAAVMNDPNRDLAIDNMNSALDDFRSAANANGGLADPGGVNEVANILEAGVESKTYGMGRSAALLGYTSTLQRMAGSNLLHLTQAERTLLDELSEERYFVVLMAYDFKSYKEKKSALKWTTRLSIRSPGNNFNEAVMLLSEAGGNVFGRHVEKLSHIKGRVRDGTVTLGELRVLGEEEEAK